MANSSTIVLIIILLFLFFTPNSQQPTLGRLAIFQERIESERAALGVLERASFGAFDPQQNHYLNLTGLRKKDKYAWSLLADVQSRARTQLSYAWGQLGLHRLQGVANTSLPVYANVTGWCRGTWVRSKVGEHLSAPQLNLSTIAPDATFYEHGTFQRNITGPSGNVRLHLSQKDALSESWRNASISELSAIMTIQDESSYGDGWELKLYGVHFQSFGAAIMTTTSTKFDGIFALPHLSFSKHTYLLSQHLLNSTLASTIRDQEFQEEELRPWDSSIGGGFDSSTTPQCEYIVYLQQYPLTGLAFQDMSATQGSQAISLLEDELRFPTGGVAYKIPELHLYMIVFSPDCGFVLESQGPPDYAPTESHHLHGPKLESYMATSKNMLLIFNLVLAFQAFLLIRQMKESSTPSTRSRISFYTMAILSIGDAFTWVVFLTAAFFIDAVFVNMIMVAFFAFLSGSFFGMKFLMDIWNVQEPERVELQRRQQLQGNDSTTDNSTNSAANVQSEASNDPAETEQLLPPPVTASRAIDTGATPIIIIPEQNFATLGATATPAATATAQPSRPSFGALYTRIYLLLLFLIFLSLNALNSWPLALRSIYTNTLATLYISYWVPQIYRNIIRNCRRALSWTFVFGQSALRLTPIIYFWGINDNVLFVETDRRILLAMVAWVWTQCLILVGQEALGPRFFISEKWKWVPAAWEYHPILREDEEGATLPLGASQVASSASGEEFGQTATSAVSGGEGEAKDSAAAKGKKVFDCAICQQDIEVAVVPAAGGAADEAAGMSGFLARRAYMVTPCRHIFHSRCLEGWMRYRLQCPICRESLPPL